MTVSSTALVKTELKRFLTDPTANALALIGGWGTGKTFAWDEALKMVKETGDAARPSYAYISLFGVNSLAQLNVAVFHHSESIKDGAKSLLEEKSLEKLRRLSTHLKSVPFLKQYGEAAEQLMAFEIRDRIVCFDDLERMSPGLTVKELMGFASFLKERRNCKIIFIAHTGKLKEKDEFEVLSEKVVDISLRFVRLPSEACAIAIREDTELAKLVREKCTDLGITNIRVIHQIWRLVRTVEPLVCDYEPEILSQAVHSLALFGWCHLQPNIAPDEQFVLKRNEYVWLSGEEKQELTSDQKAWNAKLDEYGFVSIDEFDKVLAQSVADGFFDPDAVKNAAEKKNALFVSERAGNSVSEAWAKFHHSFGGTEESVATDIFRSVRQHAKFITPINLDGAVRMMKELDFPEKAEKLIEDYIKAHSKNLEIFDLDNYAFSEEMRDPDVIAAFTEKANAVPDMRDPLEVFIHTSKYGVSYDDRRLLEALSTKELIAIFKRAGSNTARVVKAALKIAQRKPEEPDPLASRIKAAILEIGRESLLNRMRVRRYGITDAELDNVSNSKVE